MIKWIWILLVPLCSGCVFDLSLLRRDGGGSDADAPTMMADASDVGPDEDVPSDGGIDVPDSLDAPDAFDGGTDAWVADAFDGGSDSGSPLTCTDVPDISGSYRITRRLMGCTEADSGYVPLTRLDACNYEFDDGGAVPAIFDGSCEVVVLGSVYSYECDISYSSWRYRCTLTPASGGLNINCRFVSGLSPPTTDPCAFFAPEE